MKALQEAAPSLRIRLLIHEIRTADDLPAAFAAGAKERADGLITTSASIFRVERARVTELAARPIAMSPAGRPHREVEEMSTSKFESGCVPVNGITVYYQEHGRKGGVPLVLLHGGGSTIEVTFSKVLPVFARSRRVIAVEEQGHGRTTDRDAPVAFESSAEDVAGLLRHLTIDKADIFGFSNGASIALQIAVRHPQIVRKLVFASSMTRRDGAQPQFWKFMRRE